METRLILLIFVIYIVIFYVINSTYLFSNFQKEIYTNTYIKNDRLDQKSILYEPWGFNTIQETLGTLTMSPMILLFLVLSFVRSFFVDTVDFKWIILLYIIFISLTILIHKSIVEKNTRYGLFVVLRWRPIKYIIILMITMLRYTIYRKNIGFKDIQTITTNTITKNPISMTYTLLLWGTIFYLLNQIDTNYDEKYTKEYSKYFTPKWLYALQFVPIFIMMNILVKSYDL